MVLPPTDDEDGGWEDEGRDFGENGGYKKEEGKPPPGPGAGRGIRTPAMKASTVSEQGGQDEGLTEDVFALGDPGDRFDHHWMNNVQSGGEEGTTNT